MPLNTFVESVIHSLSHLGFFDENKVQNNSIYKYLNGHFRWIQMARTRFFTEKSVKVKLFVWVWLERDTTDAHSSMEEGKG